MTRIVLAVTLRCYPNLYAHGIRCIGAQGGQAAVPQTGKHVRKHQEPRFSVGNECLTQASRRR